MIQFVPCIQSIGHLALSSAVFSPGVVHSPTGNSWPIEQLHQTSSPHSTRSTNLPPVYIDLYTLDFVKKGTQIMEHHLCRALFTCTVSKLIVSWCVPKPIPFYSSILFRCLIMPYLKKSVFQRRHIWDIYALWLLSTVFLWTFYPQILKTSLFRKHAFMVPSCLTVGYIWPYWSPRLPYCMLHVLFIPLSPPICCKNVPSRTRLEVSLARYTYNPSKQEMGAGGRGGVQSQPQSRPHHELETSLVYLRLYLKPKQKSDNLTLTSLLRSLLTALLTFSTGKADPWHFLNAPLFCLESFMVFLWVQESSP